MRHLPKGKQATVLLAIGSISVSLCLLTACGRYGLRAMEEMKTGDCYNKTDSYYKGEAVPCDTPHDAEVVAAKAGGVSEQGSTIVVGAGGEAREAECLGVPIEEVEAIAAERGLKFSYLGNFDAFVVESESGKLTEAICR